MSIWPYADRAVTSAVARVTVMSPDEVARSHGPGRLADPDPAVGAADLPGPGDPSGGDRAALAVDVEPTGVLEPDVAVGRSDRAGVDGAGDLDLGVAGVDAAATTRSGRRGRGRRSPGCRRTDGWTPGTRTSTVSPTKWTRVRSAASTSARRLLREGRTCAVTVSVARACTRTCRTPGNGEGDGAGRRGYACAPSAGARRASWGAPSGASWGLGHWTHPLSWLPACGQSDEPVGLRAGHRAAAPHPGSGRGRR